MRNPFCWARTHFYHDASTYDRLCDRRNTIHVAHCEEPRSSYVLTRTKAEVRTDGTNISTRNPATSRSGRARTFGRLLLVLLLPVVRVGLLRQRLHVDRQRRVPATTSDVEIRERRRQRQATSRYMNVKVNDKMRVRGRQRATNSDVNACSVEMRERLRGRQKTSRCVNNDVYCHSLVRL